MGVPVFKSVDRDAKLLEIERLTASALLHGSESLCNLLRYLTKQSLDHPGSTVKEYQIATEVFGRAADFDPRLDSTVRVQTGRLRAKLAEYYANGGLEDRVVVEIPRGSYQVLFHYRETDLRPVVPEPPGEPIVEPARHRPANQWVTTVLVSALAVVCTLTLDFVLRPGWHRSTGPEPDNALQALWLRFFDAPEPPLVVYSNAAFVGRPETGLRYFNPVADSNDPIMDHYTGVGEVMAIHELDSLFASLDRPMRLKRGRLLTWDDAKASNLIFIGSPSENLSLREIPGTGDFVFKVASNGPRHGDLSIVNLHPRAGEESVYFPTATIPIQEDYAVIGLASGLSSARHSLTLAGVTTLGTQAAVEFVCRAKRVEELFASMGAPVKGPIPNFEALLRVKVSGGVPVQSQIVAVHRQK